jgi:hypothetical protein
VTRIAKVAVKDSHLTELDGSYRDRNMKTGLRVDFHMKERRATIDRLQARALKGV